MLELLLELLWSKTLSAPSFSHYWKQLIGRPYWRHRHGFLNDPKCLYFDSVLSSVSKWNICLQNFLVDEPIFWPLIVSGLVAKGKICIFIHPIIYTGPAFRRMGRLPENRRSLLSGHITLHPTRKCYFSGIPKIGQNNGGHWIYFLLYEAPFLRNCFFIFLKPWRPLEAMFFKGTNWKFAFYHVF